MSHSVSSPASACGTWRHRRRQVGRGSRLPPHRGTRPLAPLMFRSPHRRALERPTAAIPSCRARRGGEPVTRPTVRQLPPKRRPTANGQRTCAPRSLRVTERRPTPTRSEIKGTCARPEAGHITSRSTCAHACASSSLRPTRGRRTRRGSVRRARRAAAQPAATAARPARPHATASLGLGTPAAMRTRPADPTAGFCGQPAAALLSMQVPWAAPQCSHAHGPASHLGVTIRRSEASVSYSLTY
jgi:hypothetical protein